MTNAAKQYGPKQIIGLDLIRFFAAVLVMFHHYGWRPWAEHYAFETNYHYLAPYTWFGFIGVQIFFVLSGLVIAYSAEKATASSFAKSRFIRLYPAAWICSTVTLAVVFLTGHIHMQLGGEPFTHHLAINWFNTLILNPLGPWIDGAYWTLGIELGFYVLIFALLATGRFKLLGTCITLFGAASTAICLYVIAVFHVFASPTLFQIKLANALQHREIIKVVLLQNGSFFALGVLLWLCFFHRFTIMRVLGLAFATFGCIAEIYVHTNWNGREMALYTWYPPLIIWCVAVIAIAASVRYNAAIHNALGQRGARVARRLGVVTYPLYLVHQVAGYAVIMTLKPHMPDIACMLLTMLLAISTAYGINRFLEEPLQAHLRSLLHGPRTGRIAPAATTP
jgi:peptidoglycan/LPS O-acetylase OafA/YrhL